MQLVELAIGLLAMALYAQLFQTLITKGNFRHAAVRWLIWVFADARMIILPLPMTYYRAVKDALY